ncbi:GGDEF domain-containing protein [Pseudochrobactrum sp. MP213Fo]|uniref:GGDEF domain-containing protein n=1 Tax=Pseudochrobactrum sp. MP213Fo TaxID=3022250 RepID=UPI003BA25E70
MRYLRAELFFIIMIVMLCGAGLVLFWQFKLIHDLELNHTDDSHISTLNGALALAVMFIGAAVLSGGMMLLPHMRMQVKSKGQLKIITWMIARNSEDLEQVSFSDPLTGLQSRRYFDDALREYLLQFAKIARPVVVVLIGVDRLQQFCDQLGREATDRLLMDAALCIRNATRYHDVLTHMGDGEFGLILPDMDAVAAEKMAARICGTLEASELRLGHDTHIIAASCAVAEWNGKENAPSLYQRAQIILRQKQAT